MARRAVSEVIGFVMIFAVALATVMFVSVGVIDSFESTQDFQRVENTERAFDIFASNLAEIHQNNAPSRATEITIAGGQLRYGAQGEINVTTVDGGATTEWTYPLRPVVYETGGDRRVVYEAGAVFREHADAGVMVRDPPFLIDTDRMMLTLVSSTARQSGVQYRSGRVLIRARSTSRNISVADTTGTYDDIHVRVTSPRASEWQAHFEDTELDDCTTGTDADGDEFVTCNLNASPGTVYVTVSEIEFDIER